MSATNIASFPAVSVDEGNDITFELISCFDELEKAYFKGLPDIGNLVCEWSEGEAFLRQTLNDEIAVESFVGAVLTQNTTDRDNCAITATLFDLQNGEKKAVAKRIASHARLAREGQAGAIAGATTQAHEAEFSQEMELLGDSVKSKYELAVEAGLPLAVLKTAKKRAQVCLAGAEFLGAKCEKSKRQTNGQPAAKPTTASFTQATLF